MTVVAVVVTHDRPALLRRVVSALLDQTVRPDRILIVDNASRQPAADVLADVDGLEVLRSDVNTGGAGGFALGLQAALQRHATWVWLMDDDAVPRPGALAALVHASHDLPDNAGALCSAVYEFGALALMHRRTFGACLGWETPIGGAQYQKTSVPIDTGSFVGFFVKAEVVRAVGLPDASFFLSYDDTDYSLRIRRAGWLIWLVPASQIDHLRTPESRMRACAFGLKHYYNIRNRLVVVRRYARFRFLAGVIAMVYGGAIWGRAKRSLSGRAVRLLQRAVWDGWRGYMRCERL